MAFDWKAIVRTVAPALGTALTGGNPLGGMATKAIADTLLGKANATEEEISFAVQNASPEQLIQLKSADYGFKVKMRELGIKGFEAEVEDRRSARIDLKDDRRVQAGLSGLFVVGYFVVLYFILTNKAGISQEMQSIAFLLIGALTGEVARIMAFWFGSSMGSKTKDASLVNLTEVKK